MAGPSPPERERLGGGSALGRVAISLLIVGLLTIVVAVNLPPSRLREVVLAAGQPVLQATGLDQNWRIFAPDPRDRSLAVHARVEYSDGGVSNWAPPSGGPVLGVYWDYRWRKWAEHVAYRDESPALQRAAALYVARRAAKSGRIPVRVAVRRLERPVPGPSARAGGPAPGWEATPLQEVEFSVARTGR